MENYSYSSYADSGDSSPRSRETEAESAAAWDDAAPPPARVKLMCSFGGRIQPRPHDNQLSYVGGETKILAVDRSARFTAVLAKVASLTGAAPNELCFKYQLPGEDLDALISVTNDEDLDHMMLEYDRLLRSAAKPVPRLRLFLFPLGPPPPPAAPAEPKSDREWFVDALNNVPALSSVAAHPSPPPTAAGGASPDFLFGLDKDFVPPPAVKVRDPALPQPLPADIPAKVERPVGWDPADIQRQILELQKIQIAEAQEKSAAAAGFQMSGGEAGEYYAAPRFPEMAQPPQPPPALTHIPAPAAYWPEPHTNPATRFASVAGGEHAVYFVPAAYPQAGAGYYSAVPRVAAEGLYRDGAAVYAVAPPQAQPVAAQAYAAAEGGVMRTQGGIEAGFGGAQVAYDSVGRAVYYTGAVPTYPTVTSAGRNP